MMTTSAKMAYFWSIFVCAIPLQFPIQRANKKISAFDHAKADNDKF